MNAQAKIVGGKKNLRSQQYLSIFPYLTILLEFGLYFKPNMTLFGLLKRSLKIYVGNISCREMFMRNIRDQKPSRFHEKPLSSI